MVHRRINLELIRPGPRHNHLLSPATQYLGICGDNPAGVVTVPYEHADFELLREELRYEVYSNEDARRVAGVLHAAGRDMAKMLACIPGLPGLFNRETDEAGTLTHLRLTLSASELALLPFELSMIPVGGGAEPDDIMALHQQHPTCLTRHSRSVSTQGVEWLNQPKILFVGGGGYDVPFAEHLRALVQATRPWLRDPPDLEQEIALNEKNPVYENSILTALENPSLAEIRQVFGTGGYTHVHILAHGADDSESKYQSYGIHLGQDVISGDHLASLLAASADHGVPLPRVVTLATCDSAAFGDVITPDSSVAFDLHRRGVPLVVASQFPLTIEGSVPFVEMFYSEQLWGKHPLDTIYRLRLRLYSDFGRQNHDWASLVVYEALPDNFASLLEALQYWQARKAQDTALKILEGDPEADPPLESKSEQIAQVFPTGWDKAHECRIQSVLDTVGAATEALPVDGAYEAECIGLQAACEKRLAGLAFDISRVRDLSSETTAWYLRECVTRLEASLPVYRRAARLFLSTSDRFLQRKANLHWLLTQVVCFELILGKPFSELAWSAALYSAQNALNGSDDATRAWSHSSLSELYLLRLADGTLPDSQREAYAKKAADSVNQIVELCGRSAEQATSTARQFQRYVDWWGESEFTIYMESAGYGTRKHWHAENGVVETAKRLVAILGVPPRTPGGPKPPLSGREIAPKKKEKADKENPSATITRGKLAAKRTGKSESAGGGDRFRIEMLPAENGDCLWVEYGPPKAPRRLLIDCGAVSAANLVGDLIRQRAGSRALDFELFVLTHIDADHISGAIPLFEDASLPARFGDIWFNGWRQLRSFLSVRQGEQFSKLLGDKTRGFRWNRAFTPEDVEHPNPVVIEANELPEIQLDGEMRLTLLSPTSHELTLLARRWGAALAELKRKGLLARRAPPPPITDVKRFPLEELAKKKPRRDSSVPNASSIAFLTEYGGRSALFTGDAHANVLTKSIKTLQTRRGVTGERLKINALKLSHHGSANALTKELLDVIDCESYLIPTDGTRFYHPDREAISRVVMWGGTQPRLYFNYRSDLNELWANDYLQERYGFMAEYPESGQAGLSVEL